MTGANGALGAGRVARAAPGGYTVLVGPWETFVANGALYPLPYDVANAFTPIALIASVRPLDPPGDSEVNPTGSPIARDRASSQDVP